MTQPLGRGAIGAVGAADTILRRTEHRAIADGDGRHAANLEKFFADPNHPHAAATLEALTNVYNSMGPKQQAAFLRNLTPSAKASGLDGGNHTWLLDYLRGQTTGA
jgi:hypothetical protein